VVENLTHNPKFEGSGPATGSRSKKMAKRRMIIRLSKYVFQTVSPVEQIKLPAYNHGCPGIPGIDGLTVQNIFNAAIGILIFVSKALFTLANHHCKSFSDSKSVFTCLGYSGGMTIHVLYSNKTSHIRHQCRKTTVLSCHRFLINTGVEKINNI